MALFTAVATAVGSFFSSLTIGGVAAFAVRTLASVGLSAAAQRLAGKNAPEQRFGVRTRVESGADQPQSFISGTFATAGTFDYQGATGGESGTASQRMVVTLSDLPISGVTGLWVKGVKRDILPDGTNGTSAIAGYQSTPGQSSDAPGNYLAVKVYDGTQTTADARMVSEFGSRGDKAWDANAVGLGRAYGIVYAFTSEEYFRNGFPAIIWEVEGVKYYNPAKDSTVGGTGSHRWDDESTWEASENPAVAIYNILRGIRYGGEWVYGLQGVTAAQLPVAHWIGEINRCDELVDAQGGQEPRYRASGEIPLNSDPFTVIQAFLTACNGRLSDAGGVFKLFVGGARASVMSFTDKDILNTYDQTFSPIKGLADTVNGVTGSYPAPDAGWQVEASPPLYRTDLEQEDGGRRLLVNVPFDFVPYAEQVQRLKKEALEKARRGDRHVKVLPPRAFALEPGDVIDLTSVRNGYNAKLFEVDVTTLLNNGDVAVEITEIDPSDGDWNTDTDFVPPSQPGVDDEILPPQTVASFAVTASAVKDGADTPRRPAILAVWSTGQPVTGLDDVIAIKMVVRVKATGEVVARPRTDTPEDGQSLISDGILPDVEYEVRARYITANPRPVVWTAWESVITDDLRIDEGDLSDDITTAAVPTGLSLATSLVSDGVASVQVTFNSAVGAVSYEVGVEPTGGDEVFAPTGGTRYAFETLPGTDYTIRVRSVSATGNKSNWTAPDTITAATDSTAPAVPTGITAMAGFGVVWLSWDANGEADLSHYEVKQKTNSTTPVAGANPSFTTAATASAITSLANTTQYYYWVRAVDTSGNKSDWSVSANATTSGTPAANVTNASLLGLVDATSFASTISAVDIVDSLPSSANYEGRVAYLKSDGKLYRYDGTAWTRAVDGADLVADSVTTGAVAAGAINTQQLAAGAATLEKLAVGDFTNIAAGSTGNWDSHNWDLGAGATISATHFVSPGSSLRLDDTHTQTDLLTKIECREGDKFHLVAQVRPTSSVVGMDTLSRFRLRFRDEMGNFLSAENLTWKDETTGTWTPISKTFMTPAGAVSCDLFAQSDHTAGYVYLDDIAFRLVVDGVFIADGAITAPKMAAGEVITLSAQIRDAIITNAKIADLSAAKITAGTTLSGSVIVAGTPLSTVEERASDPAVRINGQSTLIEPGKLTISARGVTVQNVEFSANDPAVDQVSWTSGGVRYIAENGQSSFRSVAAGSATHTGDRLYIYFTAGSADFSVSNDPLVAGTGQNIIVATYGGGFDITVNAGQTIIDEGHIQTGAVNADKIDTNSFRSSGLDIFGGAVFSPNFDGTFGGNGDTITDNGTTGFAMTKNGDAVFNDLVARGWLQVGSVSDRIEEFEAEAPDTKVMPSLSPSSTSMGFLFALDEQIQALFSSGERTVVVSARAKRSGVWSAWQDIGQASIATTLFAATRITLGGVYSARAEEVEFRVEHFSGPSQDVTRVVTQDFQAWGVAV